MIDRSEVPDDAVFVCGACGDTAPHPEAFHDVACALSAVMCYEEQRSGLWIPYEQHPETDRTA